MIEGQIVEVKKSLEFSRTKDKYNIRYHPLLSALRNKISHKSLKVILVGLNRAPMIVNDPRICTDTSLNHHTSYLFPAS